MSERRRMVCSFVIIALLLLDSTSCKEHTYNISAVDFISRAVVIGGVSR